MNIEQIYQAFLQAGKVVIDSRRVQEGDMFVALKGEVNDANRFASEAVAKGAAFVILDNPGYSQNDPRFILVEDSLITLQKLASMHRQKLDLPVLALTGSNGKTTTKALIAQVLKQNYSIGATLGNLNNHIGLPLTLLSFTEEMEIGVVEMGANHIGEIKTLCQIAKPEYGLITNVGKDHLEGFGSVEGVIKAKTELYQYLDDHQGTLFINSDNEILMDKLGEQEVIAYGESDDTHIKGLLAETDPFLVVKWRPNNPLGFMNDEWDEPNRIVYTQFTGAYNFENILAAICVGADFGVPDQQIKEAIEAYTPGDNRSQWVVTQSNKILLDAYNANPTSMHAAISSFNRMQGPNKVLILGDMLELGEYTDSEHENLLELLARNAFKDVFLVGPIFAQFAQKYGFKSFGDVEGLKTYLREKPLKNALVLIKGSRGIALEKVRELL